MHQKKAPVGPSYARILRAEMLPCPVLVPSRLDFSIFFFFSFFLFPSGDIGLLWSCIRHSHDSRERDGISSRVCGCGGHATSTALRSVPVSASMLLLLSLLSFLFIYSSFSFGWMQIDESGLTFGEIDELEREQILQDDSRL